MLSIAPNFDLLLEACIAEETAKTIVSFDIGMAITLDRSPIKTPGATANKKGSPDDILREAEVMLSAHRFGIWMACPFGDNVNNPDMRCKARLDLACFARKDEGAFAKIMSRMIPHMGAHIRAYHYLCFQAQTGYRGSEQITLDEVAEVITSVIQQGWLKPAPRSDYDKYLSGGNLHLIADDFKGKGRLRALWDITGYALQEGTWTKPTTVEMYFYQLAAFWSMTAPKELPTLPGIGGDGILYHQFDTPSIFWNSKHIEGLKVKKVILDEEDKNMSKSNKIVPKAVSKAPVITKQPWDPVLGDSVHAYAWWSLSTQETVAIINDQKTRSSKRPASQIAESPPAPKRIAAPKGSVAKTPTTSSKTGADPPSIKETSKAKSAEILAPVVPTVGANLGIPLPEMTGPPEPQQSPPIEHRGNAGVREASQARAKKTMKGSTMRHPNAPTPLGKGTPPVPPVEAVGTYPTTYGTDKAVASQHQAQTAVSKEIYS